ncbi:hypothetical protein SOASR030_35730 [Leminorella grimontii]|uniref:HTH marR-type domain-containing protein n=1 Tax=Leminorella grimontii TaxID=82981 RepID=A0AAV5N5S3_9GAMM|nr:MarR family winged helix-turn-helix transcriptional regulator [Leminorella grimontii]KFC93095.1 MarR family transcriptional regulator [Leminorella grimontii ATCC 33999 = DSM 5078]GKX57461.1 hypothetical protein SOASR030_35730 [Leminorella grimontii]GKX61204.1 hypothetical protein SOASR031_35190 [Leminorella grimontii]VFS62061.1 transcriptional regulator SlyA [Leminorella grimontii]
MQTPLPTEPCLCTRARRAAQRMTDYYDKALSPSGVSVNQYALLINIARLGECGTGELAQKLKLEKSTLVRTLKPLLEADLIVDVSEAKSRKRKMRLTQEGESVLQKAIPLWQQVQDELKDRLSDDYERLIHFFDTANDL